MIAWAKTALLAAALFAGLGGAASFARYGRTPATPADNPTTDAKAALGRRLFYDADLSINGTMSCATCHEQHRGFADGNATHGGVHGDPGRHNVPGLANVGFRPGLTWGDPRVDTLEAQIAIPVFGDHPVEMGMAGRASEIVRRLSADPCYRAMFATAFPDAPPAIGMAEVTMALAAFERRLISTHALYDRFLAGRRSALSSDAREGLRLFKAKGCADCHSGPDLGDGAFHAIAPPHPGSTDSGLAEITEDSHDSGRFRTPSLRNVMVTAPYLHDGSAPTVRDAIIRHSLAQPLSDEDEGKIEAFLRAMTDVRFLKDPHFSLPGRACSVVGHVSSGRNRG